MMVLKHKSDYLTLCYVSPSMLGIKPTLLNGGLLDPSSAQVLSFSSHY